MMLQLDARHAVLKLLGKLHNPADGGQQRARHSR